MSETRDASRATSRATARDAWLLALVWVALACHDALWLAIDRSVPDWDQAKYLTAALNYWAILQHPEWTSGRWWTDFWQLAPKTPPLAAVTAVPFVAWLGTGYCQMMLVHTLYSAVWLAAWYALGRLLFGRSTARWAVALAAILPAANQARLRFTLDFPMMTAVAVAFLALTWWRRRVLVNRNRAGGWWLAILVGVSLGCALLVKQQAAVFFVVPVAWTVVSALRQRQWRALGHLTVLLGIAWGLVWPWFRASWLEILSGSWRATAVAASGQQPPMWSVAGWTAYLRGWPELVSWPVVVVFAIPVAWLVLYGIAGGRGSSPGKEFAAHRPAPAAGAGRQSVTWLAVFVVASVLVASLSPNRLPRYLLPVVPPFVLLTVWAWSRLGERWCFRLRWATLSAVVVAAALNLWPIGGSAGAWIGALLNPEADRRPALGESWPHEEVMATVIARAPWEVSTIGVTASSPTVSPENLDFYGHARGFQVYGREAGASRSRIDRDLRSFTWFVTASGPFQENARESRRALAEAVATSPDLHLERQWSLPRGGTLRLYRRNRPAVEVSPSSSPASRVVLEAVSLPEDIRPGAIVPVTYAWLGPADLLGHGLALVSWEPLDGGPADGLHWTHDHAVGFGSLYTASTDGAQVLSVREQTAMRAPAGLGPGRYHLSVQLIDRRDERRRPVSVTSPDLVVTVAEDAPIVDAPELDLVSQLRELAWGLRSGPDGIRLLFDEIGRIDQYDPVQDFFDQTALAAETRLDADPSDLGSAYAWFLGRTLQRRIPDAREAARRMVVLDARNPYPHVLAAIVDLYDMEPGAAAAALDRADRLGARAPELHLLRAAAALMRGRLVRTWREVQQFTARPGTAQDDEP